MKTYKELTIPQQAEVNADSAAEAALNAIGAAIGAIAAALAEGEGDVVYLTSLNDALGAAHTTHDAARAEATAHLFGKEEAK